MRAFPSFREPFEIDALDVRSQHCGANVQEATPVERIGRRGPKRIGGFNPITKTQREHEARFRAVLEMKRTDKITAVIAVSSLDFTALFDSFPVVSCEQSRVVDVHELSRVCRV